MLGVHRQALVSDVEARPPGDGEAHQHPADLDAQIVVATRCIVQMHDETPATRLLRAVYVFSAEGLERLSRIALAAVLVETPGGFCRTLRQLVRPPLA